MISSREQTVVVVCRIGERLCALPLEHVRETMRPLPVDPIAEMPAFVLGVTLLRGRPAPVVDLRSLLGTGAPEPPRRFVTLSLGARAACLAVDSVLGVRALDAGALGPPAGLLGEIAADVVSTVGRLDDQLLLVLKAARVVPEAAWPASEARG